MSVFAPAIPPGYSPYASDHGIAKPGTPSGPLTPLVRAAVRPLVRPRPPLGGRGGLSNLGGPAIQALIKSVLAKMPQPMSNAAINSDVQNQINDSIDPQVKALRDAEAATMKNNMDAITGLGGAASQHLAGIPSQIGAIGSTEEQARAAIMDAVTHGLSASGDTVSQGLGAKLGAINAGVDGGASMAGAAASLGANIAGQAGLRGQSGLDRVAGDTSAGETYAATLPAVLQAAGLSMGNLLATRGQTQTNADVARLEATVPGLVDTLTRNEQASALSAGSQRTQTAASLLLGLSNLDTQRAIARGTLGVNNKKIGAGITVAKIRAAAAGKGRAGTNANESKNRAQSARTTAIRQINQLVQQALARHTVTTTVPNLLYGKPFGTKKVSKSVRTAQYGPTSARANTIADQLLTPYMPSDSARDALVASLVRPALWGLGGKKPAKLPPLPVGASR